MKSGNLNFLEPSGTFQAFNGTALPFFFEKKMKNAGNFFIYTSGKVCFLFATTILNERNFYVSENAS